MPGLGRHMESADGDSQSQSSCVLVLICSLIQSLSLEEVSGLMSILERRKREEKRKVAEPGTELKPL